MKFYFKDSFRRWGRRNRATFQVYRLVACQVLFQATLRVGIHLHGHPPFQALIPRRDLRVWQVQVRLDYLLIHRVLIPRSNPASPLFRLGFRQHHSQEKTFALLIE